VVAVKSSIESEIINVEFDPPKKLVVELEHAELSGAARNPL
jgi:hypothetical protein